MILRKVNVKKKWRYEYDNIKEMRNHKVSMEAAQFNTEYYSEKTLIAIYSQTIDEITYNNTSKGA